MDPGGQRGTARRDAVAGPWGGRTPCGPGEQWPQRCDEFLTAEPDRWAQTASILRSNGDAMDIGVRNGRIVGVRGRVQDRVNRGRLGPEDLHGRQANNSADRLTTPLVREGGELVPSTWDETMGRIVTPHMDGNTRLCAATAAAALKASFGAVGQPGSCTDVDHCDAPAPWGHNTAETQTVPWSRVPDRRRGPNPPALLVVDPRRTPVAAEADVHLAVRPGTNQALMNALPREVVEPYTPDRAAGIYGLETVHIGLTAELVGTAERLHRPRPLRDLRPRPDHRRGVHRGGVPRQGARWPGVPARRAVPPLSRGAGRRLPAAAHHRPHRPPLPHPHQDRAANELTATGWDPCPSSRSSRSPRWPWRSGGDPVHLAHYPGLLHRAEVEPFARRCAEDAPDEPETAIQVKWLRTRIEQAAPQALVVAD